MSLGRLCSRCCLGAVVFALSGCSEPERSALQRLGEAGYGFHVSEFHGAAAAGDLQVVDWFLEAGMAVDAGDGSGRTALLAAVTDGRSEVALRLVELGAALEVADAEGRTPLIHAACSGDIALVEALLEAGAEARASDRSGWTALTEAAFHGHGEVVAMLAPLRGAELDKALHLACVGGDVAAVGSLLRAGASVFARSSQERTALMYAAANGHMSVVKLLARNGANRYAIDAQALTAGQLARCNGFAEVAELLEEPPVDGGIEWNLSGLADAASLADGGAEELAAVPVSESGVLADLEERLVAAERAVAAVLSEGDGNPVAGFSAGEGAEDEAGSVYVRARVAAGGDGGGRVELGGLEARAGRDRELEKSADGGQAGGISWRGIPGVSDTGRSIDGRASTRVPAGRRFSRDLRPGRIDGLSLKRSISTGAGEKALQYRETPGSSASKPLIRMHGYRESQLPVMLAGVEVGNGGRRATVRLLYGESGKPVEVRPGEMIGDSGLRVVDIERRVARTKQGRGEPVDVSRMVVEYPETGQRHLLVRGQPAMSNEVCALLAIGSRNGTLFEARSNDRFSAADGDESYRVLDVRPNQVVILREDTGDTMTIPRTAY